MAGKFALEDRELIEGKNQDPLCLAKKSFMKRDFENVISVLLPTLVENKYSKDYKKACMSNIAMAYHVLGNYEEASKYYEKCDESVMNRINYFAFCHRYFKYKNIQKKKYDKLIATRLNQLLEHNKLNYVLNVYGAEQAEKYWKDKMSSLYDEQIINDIFSHQGLKICTKEAEKMEHKYAEKCKWEASVLKKNSNNKIVIGIFLTDLQRHKNSALVYQIVEELINEYEVIIYFNNIFRNKLIKSFSDKVKIKDVVQLHYGEIINLWNEDSVSLIIDMAEYGLRNNSIAIANSGIEVIKLSEIIDKTHLVISSKEYFAQAIESYMINDSILILGDLRYVRKEDLKKLQREYGTYKIVFESHALDEDMFYSCFLQRLKECGFAIEKVTLQKGVLPFSCYMEYISSFRKIVLLNCASCTEVSEVMKVSTNGYSDIDQRGYNLIYEEQSVFELIKNRVTSISESRKRRNVIKDQVLCFYENERYFCVNCTCNGDLLVFDDVIKKRNEYFVTI